MRVALALTLAALLLAAPAEAAMKPAACPTPVRIEPGLPPATFEDGPMIAQADLVSDFDGWLAGMKALNPDIARRADLKTLDREAAKIRAMLNAPMNRRVAWTRFAELNPWLHDGHNGIYMPDYRDALAAYVAKGGHILPIEVRFAADGSLRVFAVPPGVETVGVGDRVERINGRPVAEILEAMMRRATGDREAQRRAWVTRRFGALYWLLYGDTGQYDLLLRGSSCSYGVRLEGGTSLPVTVQDDPRPEDLFASRVLEGGIGYFRVDSFGPEDKQALADAAKQAFTDFAAAHITALIIDVRENGGGDDPLWQQSLIEYITTKPYVQLSGYEQRVTKDNADPGDVVGSIRRDKKYDKRFTPTPDNPLRFSGPVYILDGPFSYSATIQFIVAAQDFGIAKIAGEETAALSCQSGQSHSVAMPKTGLNAVTPIIAYTRPSGTGCARGVIPDVLVPIDEVHPERTLDALVRKIEAAK